jgi:hypothetical protein
LPDFDIHFPISENRDLIVSCLDEVAFLCSSEIQESADLVEDVEGCSGIKDGRVLQGIVVD